MFAKIDIRYSDQINFLYNRCVLNAWITHRNYTIEFDWNIINDITYLKWIVCFQYNNLRIYTKLKIDCQTASIVNHFQTEAFSRRDADAAFLLPDTKVPTLIRRLSIKLSFCSESRIYIYIHRKCTSVFLRHFHPRNLQFALWVSLLIEQTASRTYLDCIRNSRSRRQRRTVRFKTH